MTDVKWFGRDPAVLTAQIVSGVIALVMLLPLAAGITAVLVAVATAVGGLVVAAAVAKDGQLAALVGLGRAGIALAVILGVTWSDQYQVLLLIAVEQVAGLFIRDRVTAVVTEDGTRALPVSVNRLT